MLGEENFPEIFEDDVLQKENLFHVLVDDDVLKQEVTVAADEHFSVPLAELFEEFLALISRDLPDDGS